MRRLLIIAVLVLGAVSLYNWLSRTGFVTSHIGSAPSTHDAFTLTNVRINVFGDDGSRIMVVYGRKQVEILKDLSEITVVPIRVVDERTSPPGILTARRGIRKLIRRVPTIEFLGDVYAERGEDNKLATERLLLYPDEGIIEVPTHSTIHTTDSVVKGNVLRTDTSLETGIIKGNAHISRRIPLQNEDSWEIVHLRGESCSFCSVIGTYHVTGSVDMTRGGLRITCDRASYDTRDEVVQLFGEVTATDSDFIITGNRMKYDLRRDEVMVIGDGLASRTNALTTTDPPSVVITELQARFLTYARMEEQLEAETDVILTRYASRNGSLQTEIRILSNHLLWQSVHDDGSESDSTTGRCTFKGDVRMESSTGGVVGQRAIFYEDNRDLYVIGDAEAWNYDSAGVRSNEMSGWTILHKASTGENIVIDGVHGTISEGAEW